MRGARGGWRSPRLRERREETGPAQAPATLSPGGGVPMTDGSPLPARPARCPALSGGAPPCPRSAGSVARDARRRCGAPRAAACPARRVSAGRRSMPDRVARQRARSAGAPPQGEPTGSGHPPRSRGRVRGSVHAERRATGPRPLQQAARPPGMPGGRGQGSGPALACPAIRGRAAPSGRVQVRARPARCARSLKKIRTWAIGFFRVSFLFM